MYASDATFKVLSWIGRWETTGGAEMLRRMGLDVRAVTDRDLEDGVGDRIRILVVPNARCVPRRAARAVQAWVAGGGRLLATGMASYRDEDNKRVGDANDFQWSALYEATFQRWITGWPRCEFMGLDAALGREVAAVLGRRAPLRRLQLGRNQAMLVAARPGAVVLATWLDADGTTPTTDAGSTSAAVVQAQNARVVYVGENLLAPELMRSPEVQALVLALLHRLMPEGGLPKHVAATPAPFIFPEGSGAPVPVQGETIRVAVRDAAESLGVSGRAGIEVAPMAGRLEPAPGVRAGDRLRGAPGQVLQLRAVAPVMGRPYVAIYDERRLLARCPGSVTVASRGRALPVQSLDLRPNGTCRAQAFRGTLEARLMDGAAPHLFVVNTLSVEEYTAGVVPNEMPGAYPEEALQTMAAIARTFALSRRGFHKAEGHDVCSTVHCQVYGGMLTEWASTNRAVAHTAGEVVLAGDALADSTFHAVCGGVGENVERVWPQDPKPYLVAHSDGPSALPELAAEAAFRAFIDRPPSDAYCAASPRFRWTERYTAPQLQALFEKSLPVTLGAAYRGLGTLQAVRVLARSPYGRVQRMEIVGSGGTYTVDKDRIRWLWSGGRIGPGGLQSTLFYIAPDADAFDFHGGGWGHGVGMCQDGARGMALRHLDHLAIIRHYYPGTRVARR